MDILLDLLEGTEDSELMLPHSDDDDDNDVHIITAADTFVLNLPIFPVYAVYKYTAVVRQSAAIAAAAAA